MQMRMGMGLGARPVVQGFFPASLFSSGAQGAWYDPSDYSTLFQNSTGTTPVTAVEQPVRLMLDRSKGLVLGPELVTNGGPFVNTTGWTVSGGTLSVVGASLVVTSTGAGTVYITQNFSSVPGRVYYCTASTTGSGISINTYRVGPFTNFMWTIPANGVAVAHSTDTDTTSAVTMFMTAAGAGETWTLNNVSVRELPGNHATAPNDASRPVLRARYNLLTFSEQFDNAVWNKVSGTTITANASVAPDGTTTADRVVAFNAATGDRVIQSVTISNATVTASIWVKGEGSNIGKVVDISAKRGGGGAFAGSNVLHTLTADWVRVSLSFTQVTDNTAAQLVLASPASNSATDVLVWGASLLTAADQAATGGAYQRIAAATDYDTSNPVWRPYLAFDGSDDSFNLASAIPITTDMTVVRGFGRSAAGINSVGLANASTGQPYELWWLSGNNINVALNNSTNNLVASSQTQTGFFVSTTRRNATNETGRLNGVDLTPASAAAVAGSLATIGNRASSSFNNGPIYGLIVLDRELTGSELTATEQWMAGKTGVVI